MSSNPGRRHALACAAVVALAISVRLWHLAFFDDLAFHRMPFGDSLTYAEEAARLVVEGPFAGTEPYFQGPLYPILLAMIRAVGLELTAAYVIQCVSGSLTVLGVMLIGSRVLSRRAGLLAGALYALYDAAIFFDLDLLDASPVATLVTGGLLAFVAASFGSGARAPRLAPLFGALAGAMLALAAWGRPNLAVPLLVLCAWTALRKGPGRGARIGFVATGALVLLLPLARNLVVAGEPVFISSAGGVNFYIGNHAGATGTFGIPPASGLANERRLDAISRAVASEAAGRELGAGAASTYWLRRGIRELTASPAHALELYSRKALLLLSAREIPNHLELDFVRSYSPVLAWTPVRALWLLPLAVFGAVLLARHARMFPLLLYALAALVSVVPFFVTARYRLPVMPIAAVMAGGGLDLILRALGARRERRMAGDPGARPMAIAAIAGALALGVALLPIVPPSVPVASHVNLGALHAELGELDAAEIELRRALAIAPEEPRALENLGVIAFARGEPEVALAWLERAVASDPRSVPAWNARGVALAELERFDEALASIERALAIFPGWPEGHPTLEAIWRVYLAHCRREAARAGIEAVDTGEAIEALVTFLRSRGYERAADRIASAGPVPSPR